MTSAGIEGLAAGVSIGSALWAGGIAASKNRRVWLWAIIGWQLSLIGVIIALRMSPVAPRPRKQRIKQPRLQVQHEAFAR